MKFLAGLFFLMIPLFAQECADLFKENEFPEKELNIVLKSFKIPREDWSSIVSSLAELSKDVETIVSRNAGAMERNPFSEPRQQLIIGRLYKEAYLQIFTAVMKEFGVKEDQQIYEMFNEMEGEKANAILECYRNRPK